MHSWLGIGTESVADYSSSFHGKERTASLEAGKKFAISKKWVIEPQAQIYWQYQNFDKATDPGGTIRYDNNNSWTGVLERACKAITRLTTCRSIRSYRPMYGISSKQAILSTSITTGFVHPGRKPVLNSVLVSRPRLTTILRSMPMHFTNSTSGASVSGFSPAGRCTCFVVTHRSYTLEFLAMQTACHRKEDNRGLGDCAGIISVGPRCFAVAVSRGQVTYSMIATAMVGNERQPTTELADANPIAI